MLVHADTYPERPKISVASGPYLSNWGYVGPRSYIQYILFICRMNKDKLRACAKKSKLREKKPNKNFHS